MQSMHGLGAGGEAKPIWNLRLTCPGDEDVSDMCSLLQPCPLWQVWPLFSAENMTEFRRMQRCC